MASSSSGTRKSRDVRDLRLNRSLKAVILDGSDESGRVHLTQHGATYLSQRSGQGRLYKDQSTSFGATHQTSRPRLDRGSDRRVRSRVCLSANGIGISVFLTKIPLRCRYEVPRDPESQTQVGEDTRYLRSSLGGRGDDNENLDAWPTTKSSFLLPAREGVSMKRISTARVSNDSTARPGIVAIFWLRNRFCRLHPQDAT